MSDPAPWRRPAHEGAGSPYRDAGEVAPAPSYRTLTYEVDGRVARLTFDRPEQGNSITPDTPVELADAVERADLDPRVHVIVLSGRGKGFCGGYDLAASAEGLMDGAMTGATPRGGTVLDPTVQMHNHDPAGTWDPMVDYAMMSRFTRGFASLLHANKPTVASIHGFCVAGGTDIALHCDQIVIAADAKIGYPPTRVWGVPSAGLWAHRLGDQRAKRLLLTGDTLTGREAAEWGLAIEAPEPERLAERTEALVQRIAAMPLNQPDHDQARAELRTARPGRAEQPDDLHRLRRHLPSHPRGLRLPAARRRGRLPAGRARARRGAVRRRRTRHQQRHRPPQRPGVSTMSSTHEVFNQVPPLVGHDTSADPALLEGIEREGAGWALEEIREVGRLAGTAEAIEWGRLAERVPPRLLTHDRYGRRIDEVEYVPAYHRLMETAVSHGIHAAPWGDDRPGAHVARAAKFYSWNVDAGHGCPISMTYAVVPALRANPALAARFEPLLTNRVYDFGLRDPETKQGLVAGMSMTEKQGGSDVRANTTTATPQPDGTYRIVGHKWFTSAPMSDMFLTLAQAPGGLSCFLLPRVLPGGEANPIRFLRLKDKARQQVQRLLRDRVRRRGRLARR
ncbi:crotonase/enoyl-CoA hydratase family protein [Nocardioides convexus]|uniref:crotonase/enoyl-CoA hydratase family protein n=1 Tax=Nocardioides convexus TaxID=2712224 RepID=UPI002418A0B9|nr:crotonase/enoyl-CoA hydratase family protein [Nocardioides convexus]